MVHNLPNDDIESAVAESNVAPSAKTVTWITPGGLSLQRYLAELYRYRPLLSALTYRSLRAKYAQTLAGMLWVLVNPLVNLLILAFVFGVVATVDMAGRHPLLYTSVGLVTWTYFSNAAGWAATAMVNAQEMIRKIYFPRLLVPLSVSVVALIDLAVSAFLMVALAVFFGETLTTRIWWLVPILGLMVLMGSTAAVWISALCIRYRDFQHVLPFLLRIGLYASPVAYSIRHIDTAYQALFYVNPLSGLMEASRWCLFGGPFPQTHFFASLLWLVFGAVGALYLFHRAERTMADII